MREGGPIHTHETQSPPRAPRAVLEEALPGKQRLRMVARTVRALLAAPQPQTHPPLSAAHLPAMHGRLELIRDANGVAHIYADHEPDLFTALGYVQAADRFVLLDSIRHLGAGRLCELIGNFAAPKGNELLAGKRVQDIDAFVRPLGFEAQSERDYARLDARARDCLEAYAMGINTALRATHGVYPPEYLLLGPVRPWRASDALLAAHTCALSVALAPFEVELTFDAVRAHLGDAAARRLYPDAPWDNVPAGYTCAGGAAAPEVPLRLAGTGSNNWAVSAARSASGAPLLANDPHVPLLPLPTFWYHAHLECRRYRVQGGLMLGCPVFGYGHNGYCAWGCTTAFRDAWDLYRIHRLPGDPSRYRTVTGSDRITRHRESHRVRFGRDVAIEWESCAHGIIYPGWRHHDGTDLAVRLVPADLASYFEGYLALAEAQTVDAHRTALARINDGPVDFNHVYAHKDGHIGWEVFGRLPRRRGDGLFVRDAHDPTAQWEGWVPFAEMPKMLNPARGFVASANSIVDPDNFAVGTTAVHVEPRYRHARLESFLSNHGAHSTQTFAALQRDVGSDYGVPVRNALVSLLHDCAGRADCVGQAVQVLTAWPGDFSCAAAGAPLLLFTQQALARRAFGALLGSTLALRFLTGGRAVPRLQRLLCDTNDPLRADIEEAAGKSLRQLTEEAFAEAVERLEALCGAQPEQWRLGDIQRLRMGTLLAELPLLGRFFLALDAPFPGDINTVSPAVSFPTARGLRPIVGATSRFICDLARPDEALFAHSSGPSGDVGSTFFSNSTPAWYRYEYFRSALWKPTEVPNPVEHVVVEPAW